MKKFMLACLLAGTGHVFAQDISITELRSFLYNRNSELTGTQLSDKGFSKGPGVLLPEQQGMVSKASWQYLLKIENKKRVISTVSLFQPEAGDQSMVQLETFDVNIYRSLLNQLTKEGFYYTETGTVYGLPQLHFNNNREEILAMTIGEGDKKIFQLRIRPDSGSYGKAIYRNQAKPRKTATVKPAKASSPARKKVATKARKSA